MNPQFIVYASSIHDVLTASVLMLIATSGDTVMLFIAIGYSLLHCVAKVRRKTDRTAALDVLESGPTTASSATSPSSPHSVRVAQMMHYVKFRPGALDNVTSSSLRRRNNRISEDSPKVGMGQDGKLHVDDREDANVEMDANLPHEQSSCMFVRIGQPIIGTFAMLWTVVGLLISIIFAITKVYHPQIGSRNESIIEEVAFLRSDTHLALGISCRFAYLILFFVQRKYFFSHLDTSAAWKFKMGDATGNHNWTSSQSSSLLDEENGESASDAEHRASSSSSSPFRIGPLSVVYWCCILMMCSVLSPGFAFLPLLCMYQFGLIYFTSSKREKLVPTCRFVLHVGFILCVALLLGSDVCQYVMFRHNGDGDFQTCSMWGYDIILGNDSKWLSLRLVFRQLFLGWALFGFRTRHDTWFWRTTAAVDGSSSKSIWSGLLSTLHRILPGGRRSLVRRRAGWIVSTLCIISVFVPSILCVPLLLFAVFIAIDGQRASRYSVSLVAYTALLSFCTYVVMIVNESFTNTSDAAKQILSAVVINVERDGRFVPVIFHCVILGAFVALWHYACNIGLSIDHLTDETRETKVRNMLDLLTESDVASVEEKWARLQAAGKEFLFSDCEAQLKAELGGRILDEEVIAVWNFIVEDNDGKMHRRGEYYADEKQQQQPPKENEIRIDDDSPEVGLLNDHGGLSSPADMEMAVMKRQRYDEPVDGEDVEGKVSPTISEKGLSETGFTLFHFSLIRHAQRVSSGWAAKSMLSIMFLRHNQNMGLVFIFLLATWGVDIDLLHFLIVMFFTLMCSSTTIMHKIWKPVTLLCVASVTIWYICFATYTVYGAPDNDNLLSVFGITAPKNKWYLFVQLFSLVALCASKPYDELLLKIPRNSYVVSPSGIYAAIELRKLDTVPQISIMKFYFLAFVALNTIIWRIVFEQRNVFVCGFACILVAVCYIATYVPSWRQTRAESFWNIGLALSFISMLFWMSTYIPLVRETYEKAANYSTDPVSLFSDLGVPDETSIPATIVMAPTFIMVICLLRIVNFIQLKRKDLLARFSDVEAYESALNSLPPFALSWLSSLYSVVALVNNWFHQHAHHVVWLALFFAATFQYTLISLVYVFFNTFDFRGKIPMLVATVHVMFVYVYQLRLVPSIDLPGDVRQYLGLIKLSSTNEPITTVVAGPTVVFLASLIYENTRQKIESNPFKRESLAKNRKRFIRKKWISLIQSAFAFFSAFWNALENFVTSLGYEMLVLIHLIGVSVGIRRCTGALHVLTVFVLSYLGRRRVLTFHMIQIVLLRLSLAFYCGFFLLGLSLPVSWVGEEKQPLVEVSQLTEWWRYLGFTGLVVPMSTSKDGEKQLDITADIFTFFLASAVLRLLIVARKASHHKYEMQLRYYGHYTFRSYLCSRADQIESALNEDQHVDEALPPLKLARFQFASSEEATVSQFLLSEVDRSSANLREKDEELEENPDVKEAAAVVGGSSIGNFASKIIIFTFPPAVFSFFNGASARSVVDVVVVVSGLLMLGHKLRIYWSFPIVWPLIETFCLVYLLLVAICNIPIVASHIYTLSLGPLIGFADGEHRPVALSSLRIVLLWSVFVQRHVFHDFGFIEEIRNTYIGKQHALRLRKNIQGMLEAEEMDQLKNAQRMLKARTRKLNEIRQMRSLTSPSQKPLEAVVGKRGTLSTSSSEDEKADEQKLLDVMPFGQLATMLKEDKGPTSRGEDQPQHHHHHHHVDPSDFHKEGDDSEVESALGDTVAENEAAGALSLQGIFAAGESVYEALLSLVDSTIEWFTAHTFDRKEYHELNEIRKKPSRFVRLVLACGFFLERHTGELCNIVMVAAFAQSGSVFDGVASYFALIFGMIADPWPPLFYWNCAIMYQVCGIITKSLIGLATRANVFSLNSETWLVVIFQKNEHKTLGNSMFQDLAADFVIFVLLLAHKNMYLRRGALGGKSGFSFLQLLKRAVQRFGCGVDLYSFALLFDVISLIYLVLNYYEISGRSQGSFVESVRSNLLPGPLVVTMFFCCLLMVVDRAMYIRKHTMAKLIFHLLLVTALHGWYFVWGSLFAPSAKVITMFFSLKTAYCVVSCFQIRHGFPMFPAHDPFTRRPYMPWAAGYYFCRYFPFIFELRTLLDWTCTKSSLDIFYWFKLEDIHHELYKRFVDIVKRRDTNPTPGSVFSRPRKFLQGGFGFLALLLVIFFPLVYYSTFNPGLVPNRIERMHVEYSFAGTSPFYAADLLQNEELGSGVVEALLDQFSWLQPLAEGRYAQELLFPRCSPSKWTLSPGAIQFLAKNLNNSLGNGPAEHDGVRDIIANNANVYIRQRILIERTGGTGNSLRQQIDTQWELPDEGVRNMFDIVTSPYRTHSSGRSMNGTISLPHFYSPIVLNEPNGVRFFHSPLDCNLTFTPASLNPFEGLEGFEPAASLPHHVNGDTTGGVYCCVKCHMLAEVTKTVSNDQDHSSASDSADDSSNNVVRKEITETEDFVLSTRYLGFSDRIPTESNFLPNVGIVALYTTFIFAISRVLRDAIGGTAYKVTLEDMGNPLRVSELVNLIYLSRSEGRDEDLLLEEQLYLELIDLLRSPETLLQVTGERLKLEGGL